MKWPNTGMPLHYIPAQRRFLTAAVLPNRIYKLKTAFESLRFERLQTDQQFRLDVAGIKAKLREGTISSQMGDQLYFRALDASVRRARGPI